MPAAGICTGFGGAPTIVSVEAPRIRTVRVLFSEHMADDAALGAPSSYVLTPLGVSVARAILVAIRDPIDSSAVLITVDGDMTTGVDVYNLAVTGSLTDLAGNTLAVPFDMDFSVSPSAGGVPDHEALALRRLIAQYRTQPNIESVIRLIGRRAIGVDQESANIEAFRGIDSAYGIGLDRLGRLLEMERNAYDDGAYRVILRGQILARASHGHPDEVIAVLLKLLDGGPDPTHEMHYPAAVVMESVNIPNAFGWVYAPIVRRAVKAGVQYQLLHNMPAVTIFSWDNGEWDWDGISVGGAWAEAS